MAAFLLMCSISNQDQAGAQLNQQEPRPTAASFIFSPTYSSYSLFLGSTNCLPMLLAASGLSVRLMPRFCSGHRNLISGSEGALAATCAGTHAAHFIAEQGEMPPALLGCMLPPADLLLTMLLPPSSLRQTSPSSLLPGPASFKMEPFNLDESLIWHCLLLCLCL